MPALRIRLMVALFAALLLGAAGTAATDAATVGLRFPALLGTQWEVLAGYNTATHEGIDPYALDLWRVDRQTGGTAVLSPVTGTVGYVSDTCVSVRTTEMNVLMCHVFAEPGLVRGQPVQLGQRLATVAPDGQAENNGTAHIHLQLNRPGTYGYGSGDPLPFDGQFSLDGTSLPAIGTYNGYAGVRIVSTNPGAPVAHVDAGEDVEVEGGVTVSLNATGVDLNQFEWIQYQGPPVSLQVSGPAATFVAPSEVGVVLGFQVRAMGTLGEAADTVRVTVRGALPLPAGGLGLVVWKGGTLDLAELQQQGVRSIWAFVAGKPVGYVVGAPDFVSAEFLALYPGLTFPGETFLLVSAATN